MLWYFLGLIYLAILAWQDVKHARMVSERYNYIMIGLSVGLIMLARPPLLYLFGAVAASIVLGLAVGWAGKRFFGQVDALTLGWIFYGFALLNPGIAVSYSIMLILATAAYFGLARLLYPSQKRLPYYPVIFVIFLVTGIIHPALW